MKHTRCNIYRHLNGTISFSKKWMLFSGLLTLTVTAISLLFPYLYKTLVDDVMTQGNIQLLYIVIPAMIGVHLLKVLVAGIQTYVNKRFSYPASRYRNARDKRHRDCQARAAGKHYGADHLHHGILRIFQRRF